jgi:hypothetical protein
MLTKFANQLKNLPKTYRSYSIAANHNQVGVFESVAQIESFINSKEDFSSKEVYIQY